MANLAARLTAAGFVGIDEGDEWPTLPASGFVVRDGAIIAWRTPADASAATPFRLAGAHTDSPGLRIKPHPDTTTAGWRQINVEVYGGILNNTWLDRDLGIAGRMTLPDGRSVLVDVHEAIARVPQLAVHLDRGINDGLKLDPQHHLRPVWALDTSGLPDFGTWIAGRASGERPSSWELCLYDVQPAAIMGGDNSMIASGRIDNLVSCWAATHALLAAEPTESIAAIVFNDHEEVGSSSSTGAAGSLLERVLERHVLARHGDRADLLRSLARSSCVSVDNAHAVHPNYLDRHDPDHRPIINAGPAIKVNANQRYATSSKTGARFAQACDTAGVPHQVFVSRNNVPCGSTIGPITATRLGIDTVDVGIAQLSMHSARELCGADDPLLLARALRATFEG